MILPQSLFSNYCNDKLKPLLDADNVGMAIYVSGNFSRFYEGAYYEVSGIVKGAL